MKNISILFFLYCMLCSWDCQSIKRDCYWQTCRTISETDTFYSPLENRIVISNDTIYNQHVLIKQGLKGNRILGLNIRYTDTFFVKNDTVFWKNNSLTGLFFNKTSFERGDTVYFLRTRSGFTPEPVRFIPVEKVVRNGQAVYKYKSSISNKATQLDNFDLKTIFDGEYPVEDGYYYIHPILGEMERENTYHLPGHHVNKYYSSNDNLCSDVLKAFEEKINRR